jgi:Ca2+-binding RTX toxin-like protein
LGWGFYTQELPFGDVINIVFTQSLAEAGFSFPSANDTQLVTALDYPNDRNWHMFLTFHYDTGETYADPQSSLSGDSGADTLEGTQFRDELLGLAGKDTLTGGEGEDSLHGGAGDDLLRGGEGDDRLVGGRGDDTLWGGPGEDTFVHGAASGRDRIADFEQGDLLALRGYSVGGRDLEFQDLDTNGDGVLGDGDAPVSVNGRGDLVLHLAAFGGHRPDTITLQHIPVLDSTDLVFR